MSNTCLRIAVAQYPLTWQDSWAAYCAHVESWLLLGVEQRAQFLVFPEYGAMELVSLLGFPEQVRAMHLREQLAALQQFREPLCALFTQLAARHGVWILAPSFPVRDDAGVYFNRAWLCAPDGRYSVHEKIIMTRFEREEWGVSGGAKRQIVDTPWAKVAVTLCYDSEFPLLVRRAVEAGVELVLVPSCTDTTAGYHRVRGACAARAIENQCFVAQAVTVGDAPWCHALDVNVGAGGIFAPPEHGRWDTGVLAQGVQGTRGWVIADLDFSALRVVRENGQVLNHRDWSESTRMVAVEAATWRRDDTDS